MIHANIIEGVPDEKRDEITRALMGLETPAVPAKLAGARMPPIGVPVRKLSGVAPNVAIAALKQAMPGGGGARPR